ncbi:DUF2172 domain-containing protein [Marinovum sp. F03]|uniref:DUF2172 domain-containing protein n=1 Tax=Marinovum sp. F03 TaxID=3449226 RepID=UPI003EDB79BA
MLTELSALYDRLFPLCRSITGPGLRDSLNIFGEVMPLEMHGIPSGTEVLDWTVPPEWAVESARLIGPDGEVVCDFADHNLHLVNYSQAFQGKMSLEELQPHLHSLPHLPDAIPLCDKLLQSTLGVLPAASSAYGAEGGRVHYRHSHLAL